MYVELLVRLIEKWDILSFIYMLIVSIYKEEGEFVFIDEKIL